MNLKSLIIAGLVMFLYLALNSCKDKKLIHPYLKFDCKVIGKTENHLLIKTTMINATDESLPYLTMTCDSLSIYAIDSKAWGMPEIICQHNVPMQNIIPPHGEFANVIKLDLKNKAQINDKWLKIGFKFFSNDLKTMQDKPDSILWSKNVF